MEITLDIIDDVDFITLVKINLSKAIKERLDRKPARDGYRYKRDWYDKMSDAKQLNLKFFIENIADIWLKKSSLNMVTRNVVEHVCNTALIEFNKTKAESNEL